MSKISKYVDKYNLLSFIYWAIFFVPVVLIENYLIYSTLIIISVMGYIPYKIFLNKKKDVEMYKDKSTGEVIKKELPSVFVVFLVFLGVLMLFNSIALPQMNRFSNFISNTTTKTHSEKVLELENLEIYVDNKDKKVYSFYKMNGSLGIEYMDTENLILFEDSEMPTRYGSFYKIDNYELAFATHRNQLYTEGLFKFNYNGKEYVTKAYIPQENALSLLTKTGFKEALNLEFKDGSVQNIYINQDSQEIAISNNDIIITEKYVETPYNIEDYFSYRYDIFNNSNPDKTMLVKDKTVSMINTYYDISDDIQRVTFYLECTEDYSKIYSEVVEIIFKETAYVFRTGVIDTSNIKSVSRAS